MGGARRGGRGPRNSQLFLPRRRYSKIIASTTVSMLLSPGGVTSASHGKFPQQKDAILSSSSKNKYNRERAAPTLSAAKLEDVWKPTDKPGELGAISYEGGSRFTGPEHRPIRIRLSCSFSKCDRFNILSFPEKSPQVRT